jgi:tetratricopeptide (TPR) repeat protein
MVNLYELLGADSRSDKAGLKAAFRKAAKAAHPDVRPDDEDASWRFRQIVRAHEILSDDELRAAYDHVVTFEQRIAVTRKRTMLDDILGRIVVDSVAVLVLATALFGAYLMAMYIVRVPVEAATLALASPSQPAAMTRTMTAVLAPAPQSRTTGRTGDKLAMPPAAAAADRRAADRNEIDRGELDRATERVRLASAVVPMVPAVTAAALNEASAVLGPIPELARRDARFFRARGIVAYHFGDFARAIANFDAAIRLDPGFERAFRDRAAVFTLMSRFDRAAADITQADRLRSEPAAGEHRTATVKTAALNAARHRAQQRPANTAPITLARQSPIVLWPAGG